MHNEFKSFLAKMKYFSIFELEPSKLQYYYYTSTNRGRACNWYFCGMGKGLTFKMSRALSLAMALFYWNFSCDIIMLVKERICCRRNSRWRSDAWLSTVSAVVVDTLSVVKTCPTQTICLCKLEEEKDPLPRRDPPLTWRFRRLTRNRVAFVRMGRKRSTMEGTRRRIMVAVTCRSTPLMNWLQPTQTSTQAQLHSRCTVLALVNAPKTLYWSLTQFCCFVFKSECEPIVCLFVTSNRVK